MPSINPYAMFLYCLFLTVDVFNKGLNIFPIQKEKEI